MSVLPTYNGHLKLPNIKRAPSRMGQARGRLTMLTVSHPRTDVERACDRRRSDGDVRGMKITVATLGK
jgi:hypothetical protein